MFEDHCPLLFIFMSWTCSKINAFIKTNMSWVRHSTGIHGYLKKPQWDKKPTKQKKSWQMLKQIWNCKWRCITIERGRGKSQFEAAQIYPRLPVYSQKLAKINTEPAHDQLKWKSILNISMERGKVENLPYLLLFQMLGQQNKPALLGKSTFARALRTPEPKFDCFSLQKPTKHTWENSCKMISSSPPISHKKHLSGDVILRETIIIKDWSC